MNLLIIVLSVIGILIFLWLGYIIGRKIEENDWKLNRLPMVVKERLKTSRAVLGGQFSEQLAPYLPDFKYSPTECRFMGKPIDFIVFKGMDNDSIEQVIFVEVKSGKGKSLNRREKTLKDAIESKKVSWEKYEIPEDVTEKREE
ncbi:MAG: hypothetical protein NTZ02_02265 [Candidatus Woesearchaeota archaeon]|nr:hypothetical protein [Candidatus Woesearchaeota archaeon]